MTDNLNSKAAARLSHRLPTLLASNDLQSSRSGSIVHGGFLLGLRFRFGKLDSLEFALETAT